MEKAEKMRIRITCDTKRTLALDQLIPLQSNLKTITDDKLNKLKALILKDGYSFPGFVWHYKTANTEKYYILDSHQRCQALKSLQAEGFVIPKLPVVFIDADNKKHAKQKLLEVSSQFGEYDREGYIQFVHDITVNEYIRLVDGVISFDMPKFEPVREDEQGKLDEIKPDIVACPHCGKEFDARENRT